MSHDRKKFNQTITKILNSVKRGDKNKMDELFNITFNHFYGYALVKLWNKSQAEDAVMSMYENIMKYIDSFDADKGGAGWMFTILNRIIYNLNAEEKELQQYERTISEGQYIKDLDQMYETIGLTDAVSDLDDIDKNIVFMYYFERRTLEEIAEALGISTSAVHKKKQQILKKMKKFLALGGKSGWCFAI